MAKRQQVNVVARHLKQIKAGAKKPGHVAARRAARLGSIEQCLVSPSLEGVLQIAIDLEALGWVEGAAAITSICEAEADGWSLLQTSFAYSCWNVRICNALCRCGRLKAGWSSTHLNLAARCLAHAMATGDDTFAMWCGRRLLDNFTSGVGLYDRSPREFEPFMVHLFARWQSLPVPTFAIPCAPLAVYKELLDSWHDEKAFAGALVKACDYHVEHSVEGRIAHAEFESVPHNVFPAEILAVKRLHTAMGLSWPVVDHPLLITPLAELPPSVPEVRSDLLDRITSAAQVVLPEVFPSDGA